MRAGLMVVGGGQVDGVYVDARSVVERWREKGDGEWSHQMVVLLNTRHDTRNSRGWVPDAKEGERRTDGKTTVFLAPGAHGQVCVHTNERRRRLGATVCSLESWSIAMAVLRRLPC